MNLNIRAIISWIIVAWASKVFLFSLPYKFTKHPDTEHIFGTIGKWISDTINGSLGELFSNIGSYVVGSFELITSLVLLAPLVVWIVRGFKNTEETRRNFHAIGGLMASLVMAGAVFFHLFTPLGIEVLHNGVSDGGSLFYAAVSILVGGIVLFVINRRTSD
jgi:heme A synthase